jgi:ferredoxin
MIQFEVEDNRGHKRSIEIPEDINLSLMEVLKASDYPVEATCGGMALCATCYVEVVEGLEKLPGPTDAELDMLDTLPFAMPISRLACQIKISEQLQNVLFRFKE